MELRTYGTEGGETILTVLTLSEGETCYISGQLITAPYNAIILNDDGLIEIIGYMTDEAITETIKETNLILLERPLPLSESGEPITVH